MNDEKITISKFAKDNNESKATSIKREGVYVDSYFDNDHLVNIYAIQDFFVEVVISIRKSRIVDYIPFERGFRQMKARGWSEKD